MIATPIRGSYFLSLNASTYNSCSNCGGQCTSNCLFNSCKERNAGGENICTSYGCYGGGCYLTCIVSSCAGNCYDGCKTDCTSTSKTSLSCLNFCSNSSDSMYTTCAGLATKKNGTPIKGYHIF